MVGAFLFRSHFGSSLVGLGRRNAWSAAAESTSAPTGMAGSSPERADYSLTVFLAERAARLALRHLSKQNPDEEARPERTYEPSRSCQGHSSPGSPPQLGWLRRVPRLWSPASFRDGSPSSGPKAPSTVSSTRDALPTSTTPLCRSSTPVRALAGNSAAGNGRLRFMQPPADAHTPVHEKTSEARAGADAAAARRDLEAATRYTPSRE